MRHSGRATRTRVGRAIQRFRLLRRLSQERLAELAGRSWKHLGQIERGQVNASLDVLESIAQALAIDIGDLFPPPRGRRRSKAAMRLITVDEIDQILEIAGRVKGVRVARSKRASR
ncbi:MAG TPA: helix-turn-helix transcriptional regulator [Vicinamibacterales bacterium]|jgi:transcriptional regulator with XRE-family HTH domain|nr:helix-turn-helix transcriptional regulator [Vicinamibacterales bacterium]